MQLCGVIERLLTTASHMADAAATTCAKSELWCALRAPCVFFALSGCVALRLATNPLNRWSVLDYFAITHFYQPEGCLNEVALAEGKHRSETRRVVLLCLKRSLLRVLNVAASAQPLAVRP